MVQQRVPWSVCMWSTDQPFCLSHSGTAQPCWMSHRCVLKSSPNCFPLPCCRAFRIAPSLSFPFLTGEFQSTRNDLTLCVSVVTLVPFHFLEHPFWEGMAELGNLPGSVSFFFPCRTHLSESICCFSAFLLTIVSAFCKPLQTTFVFIALNSLLSVALSHLPIHSLFQIRGEKSSPPPSPKKTISRVNTATVTKPCFYQ